MGSNPTDDALGRGDPNGWAGSAVRPIGSGVRVAHDQIVIFAGRQSAQPLANCSACGRVSGPYWWRWRAYRLDDPEFGDLPRVAIYCQSCADRKFGPPRRRPLVERRKEPRPQTTE